jgi:hypothetical protein
MFAKSEDCRPAADVDRFISALGPQLQESAADTSATAFMPRGVAEVSDPAIAAASNDLINEPLVVPAVTDAPVEPTPRPIEEDEGEGSPDDGIRPSEFERDPRALASRRPTGHHQSRGGRATRQWNAVSPAILHSRKVVRSAPTMSVKPEKSLASTANSEVG